MGLTLKCKKKINILPLKLNKKISVLSAPVPGHWDPYRQKSLTVLNERTESWADPNKNL